MASKKTTILGSSGRQAAYTARTRAALIESAQQVLAEIGPNATIEQLIEHAKVAPNTIYNHFESKEKLFSEALDQIWQEWLIWAYAGKPVGESFQTMITVYRKLFLVGETHPLLSSILKNNLGNPDFLIQTLQGKGLADLKKVGLQGELSKDSFEQRGFLWTYCLIGILHGVHISKKLSPSQADQALEIALSIWDMSPAKAKKLVSHPIN
ncbi:MAG: TetR/AcrR family transcriptional regulator [Rhodoluna sp.]